MDIRHELKRLKETGVIDGSYGSIHIGYLLDMYNKQVDNQKEKYYAKDISDRDEYYFPLWRRAVEDLRSGFIGRG